MANEKPKEGVKTENNDHINLKVAGQDGSVVQFKIKRHIPLSKLMKAYCERQGLSMRQIRFRFDGQPINETDTPAQLEMEDEDTIDVFQQQTGGVYCLFQLYLEDPDPWNTGNLGTPHLFHCPTFISGFNQPFVFRLLQMKVKCKILTLAGITENMRFSHSR
ncbi:small ubiquitin-related modifier 2-like [Erinaceus europaeus]|uniref:Small ubiquitin-related modifier 2-like n=1 Tax=Erinaceus europaeus TaxID=9365 RepID=A0ABM3WQ02_ERIEU|nr:small ubiquitin-related modifier 2-like [Erinaceus europaeus]